MSNFSLPTQYSIDKIEIDGNDVIGLFSSIDVYENIYRPIVTGSIQLIDTDASDFIMEYEIEGSESIEFEFTNANDDTLTFKGVLNGLRNKSVVNQTTIYTFDFTTEQLRRNEETFIVKRFKEDPKTIIEEMVEKLGGESDKVEGEGLPMSFTGSRRRPTDIIKYVLTHGVTQNSQSSETSDEQEENASGTTGFLCWQTLNGYRFNSIDTILKGEAGEDLGEFFHQVQNNNLPMEDAMSSVLDYDFKEIGDIQSKMRSGAFRNVVVSFDIDKGLYKEFTYDDEKNMTEKQKAIVTKPTRYITKAYCPELFEDSCTKANSNYWDQSRRYLAQNAVRQNTFSDQSGTFVLPPRFEFKAGDVIHIKIAKVESEKGRGYNEKHSGRYVIKQVGFHLLSDGKAYTKIKTVRSTIQQDLYTSEKA